MFVSTNNSPEVDVGRPFRLEVGNYSRGSSERIFDSEDAAIVEIQGTGKQIVVAARST